MKKKLDELLNVGRLKEIGIKFFKELLTQVLVLTLIGGGLYLVFYVVAGAQEMILATIVFMISITLCLVFPMPRLLTFRLFLVTTFSVTVMSVLYTGGATSPDMTILLLLPVSAIIFGRKPDVVLSSTAVLTVFLVFGIFWFSGIEIFNHLDLSYQDPYSKFGYLINTVYAVIAILMMTLKVMRYQKRLVAAIRLQNDAIRKYTDAEKFASLGVITAGIAHEINNPVNYIQMGSVGLSQNVRELLSIEKKRNDHTNRIARVLDVPDHVQVKNEINTILEEMKRDRESISYEEVMMELGEMIESIQHGADQTSAIIKGLRTFSYEGQSNAISHVDLAMQIESVLVLLHNQYKDRITIERSFGDIPEVACWPGRINQVIMNLLSNAIQSIHGEGAIKLSLEYERISDQVEFSIQDSGCGIPDDVADKIFDPFFTTKPIGKGTGMGLAIIKQIVDDHGGTLRFESSENGTTFYLRLPVNRPALRHPDEPTTKKGNRLLLSALSF